MQVHEESQLAKMNPMISGKYVLAAGDAYVPRMSQFHDVGRMATFHMSRNSARTIAQAARGLEVEKPKGQTFIVEAGIFGKVG